MSVFFAFLILAIFIIHNFAASNYKQFINQNQIIMKKITLAIAAVVIGFVMASCGNSVSPKETIIKATEDFFAQAKTNLQVIDNAEDFLAFVDNFAQEKDAFIQDVFADYMDEEGNLKGFTEEEITDLQTQLGDMASAYNNEEALKAAEFITPLVENYENAVNALYDAVGNVDEETFHQLVENFEAAESDLSVFAAYDNVLPELQERAQAAEMKLDEVIKAMGAAGE